MADVRVRIAGMIWVPRTAGGMSVLQRRHSAPNPTFRGTAAPQRPRSERLQDAGAGGASRARRRVVRAGGAARLRDGRRVRDPNRVRAQFYVHLHTLRAKAYAENRVVGAGLKNVIIRF